MKLLLTLQDQSSPQGVNKRGRLSSLGSPVLHLDSTSSASATPTRVMLTSRAAIAPQLLSCSKRQLIPTLRPARGGLFMKYARRSSVASVT